MPFLYLFKCFTKLQQYFVLPNILFIILKIIYQSTDFGKNTSIYYYSWYVSIKKTTTLPVLTPVGSGQIYFKFQIFWQLFYPALEHQYLL